jgi:WD40 repeat protein
MALATGIRLGPYEILSPLGAGGMGEVYRARDTRLGREVAVKVLPSAFAADPDRLRRFEQEARAAGALNHPNILVLHDVGTHDGTPYLVTELLEGETLRERMTGGALPPRKAIDIALQIARGMAAAHDRGLVHRDLKPENLFLLRDGRVKILDFGIAKLTRPETQGGATRAATPTATIDTDPGLVMGTAGYMAPEQVRGLPADHRADIFALGAILYEMLSGRRAFQGETSAETMTAILREEPPEMARDGRALPPALDRIVRHCLEKSSHERFQSASDIAFALESLSGISDSGPKVAVAGAGTRSLWRRFVLPAVAALLLLAAGVFLGLELAPRTSGTSVKFQKLTFRRGTIQTARFSADGHTVYYSASWDGSVPTMYSCTPGTPGSLSLAAPANSFFLGVSPSNELAILVRYRSAPHESGLGTLARMTPGGAPREILDNVTEADWSPDGATLAVIHVVGNRHRAEYPIGTVLFESTGWITHLRVSPDGKSVAFLDHPVFPDDRGLVTIASAGAKPRVLSPVFASAQGLAWSPDGREVWFSAATVGTSRSIYAVDRGGHVRMLAALPNTGRVQDVSRTGEALITSDNVTAGILGRGRGDEKERDLTWLDWSYPVAISNDGRTLLFIEQGEGGGAHYETCLRGMDGSEPIRLGGGEAEDLSPDGKWALVSRFWTHPPELVLFPSGAGEPQVLPPTGLENIFNARYFPSGDRLLIVGNEPGHAIRAYVRDLSGGPLRPVVPEGLGAGRCGVSPDGKWVVGAIRGGGADIYPVEGGPSRPISGKLPQETALGWSADGTSLFVAVPGSGAGRDVFRLDATTGKRTPWLKIKGPEDLAGVSTGLLVFGRDDHSYAYVYSRYLSELFLAHGLK